MPGPCTLTMAVHIPAPVAAPTPRNPPRAVVVLSTEMSPRSEQMRRGQALRRRPRSGYDRAGIGRRRLRSALVLAAPLLLLQTFEAANLFCHSSAHASLLSIKCPHHSRPDPHQGHLAHDTSEGAEDCRCPSSSHSLPDGLVRLALSGVGLPIAKLDLELWSIITPIRRARTDEPTAGPPRLPPDHPPRLLS